MARVTSASLLALALLWGMLHQVSAKGFLARLDDVDDLLSGAKELLGSDHYDFAKKKLGRIELILRPLFSALAKNERGKLGHAAASYALHRIFAQRHGWHITGLESNDKGFSAWHDASPVAVLRKHVSSDTVAMLEQQLFHDGFGIHELALVAASVEYFIHLESMEKIQNVFKAQHGSMNSLLDNGETDHTLDTYMALYLIGHMVHAPEKPTPLVLEKLVSAMPKIFPNWQATRDFLREVRQSVTSKVEQVAFSDVATIVEETGERYGAFQDEQCRSMKSLLFSQEDTGPGGAGRIRLADFYGLYLTNKENQFTESLSQLRKLGALDESDLASPRVIITNYLYGASNCIASSKFYEVCCIDQCEPLLANIEREIGAPHGTPEQISDVVSALLSPSTPDGKVISAYLLQRLEEVANVNGGRVPLHGRLFAQWMHSAYPGECPYPHLAGASNPDHLPDIIQNNDILKDALATDEEMRRIVQLATPRTSTIIDFSAHEASGMVSMQEELVV